MMESAELQRWMENFKTMTKDHWLGMNRFLRSYLAGAIAGNYAAHHPDKCFDWLREIHK